MLRNAKWIKAPRDMEGAAAEFRRSFTIAKRVDSARLYASAIGVYSPRLNGRPITDAVLMPGLTSYKTRVLYQEYDVTDLLAESNELSVSVGPGWAVGHYGYLGERQVFFDEIALIARLSVKYADGSEEDIISDSAYEVYTTPITSTDIYHGETLDLTAEILRLGSAIEAEIDTALAPQDGEWIRETERLPAKEIIKTPRGETVIDFGQNMTGYVELSIKAPRGSRVVLHHAEVLDKDGNFYTDNYRLARNEITYICSGETDVFKPSYTFQGYRYVQLVEYPFDEVELDNFRSIAVNSEMTRTGRYRCGNEKINQLYHNIIWGQKSNYLDIPTDCPQRNERLGWTGDAQVFCRTAAINFDVEKFFEKWLGDVAIEQAKENGAVRGVIPVAQPHPTRISAAWGDCATIIPIELYLAYGNKKNLKKHLPMMKAWVDYLRRFGPEEHLWLGGYHYGDWLAMDAGEDSYVGATSNDLIASAFFAYSCELVVRAGDILGEDVEEYRALYKKVRAAFREYFMENGMPKEELPFTEVLLPGRKGVIDTVRKGVTQTGITLILHFGLCEESERAALAAKLDAAREAGREKVLEKNRAIEAKYNK